MSHITRLRHNEVVQMRALYEQDEPMLTTTAIAARFHCTDALVMRTAERYGWSLQAEHVRHDAIAKAEHVPTDRLDLDGARRRCQVCDQVSWTDPCAHCGACIGGGA